MGRPRRELTGMRFGLLQVIGLSHVIPGGHTVWKTLCDCGNERLITKFAPSAQSCGCLRALPEGIAAFNQLYSSYRCIARKRRLAFALSRADFGYLTRGDCHYCGIKPSTVHAPKLLRGSYTYNGIDRVDSSQGYSIANCGSCCITCNHAKSDMTITEWNAWLDRVFFRRKGN